MTRKGEKDCKIRSVEVHLDGKLQTRLLFMQSIELEVESGPHSLRADNTISRKTIDFELAPGEVAEFECQQITTTLGILMMIMLGTGHMRVELERIGTQSES